MTAIDLILRAPMMQREANPTVPDPRSSCTSHCGCVTIPRINNRKSAINVHMGSGEKSSTTRRGYMPGDLVQEGGKVDHCTTHNLVQCARVAGNAVHLALMDKRRLRVGTIPTRPIECIPSWGTGLWHETLN